MRIEMVCVCLRNLTMSMYSENCRYLIVFGNSQTKSNKYAGINLLCWESNTIRTLNVQTEEKNKYENCK